MTIFRCKKLYTVDGWRNDVIVTTDASGRVATVSEKSNSRDTAIALDGFVLPGIVNAHSHAFQYAMAGMAEYKSSQANVDDFWSWREEMYKLALTLSPEQVFAISSLLFKEMLKQGYTRVVEFHYLHHDRDGRHFTEQALMGETILKAAKAAGIGVTLVPVFYKQGNFNTPANPRQMRFISQNAADFFQLAQKSSALCEKYDAAFGIAVHSLRAADEASVKEIFRHFHKTPFHLHIAEQKKEVEDCLKACKKRPIEWLLDENLVDERTFLIHATHMSDDEVKKLATSQGTVVLCPSTEGNLGDGIFPLAKFLKHGGKICIGSDSHIGLSPLEELRWADYAQRLIAQKRCALGDSVDSEIGEFLFSKAVCNGRRAAGLGADYLAHGQPFEAIEVSPDLPILAGRPIEKLIPSLVYAGNQNWLRRVISSGQIVVENSKHRNEETINFNASATLDPLASQSQV